jgi:hypothetical protein
MPKLNDIEKKQFDEMVEEFNEITDTDGNNPFRFKYTRYKDCSRNIIKNTDLFIYNMHVHLDFKPTFDYHFYQLLKSIKTQIQKKNG